MEACDKNWLGSINQSLTTPCKAWQTAGTVKTLIIYSAAPSPHSLWIEKKNFWWPQLFSRAPKFGAISSSFWSSTIFLNGRNVEMCLVGKACSVFVRYTLPVTTPWASGGMDFSTASQNISAKIWKWKWFMWHVFQVLGKAATIAEHILNWWNALCNVSRRRLKNMQKLRQKVLEGHLWLVASATIQLFWQTNKTNQPQNHSPLTRLHRWTIEQLFWYL